MISLDWDSREYKITLKYFVYRLSLNLSELLPNIPIIPVLTNN
jgi:hypothetical protein